MDFKLFIHLAILLKLSSCENRTKRRVGSWSLQKITCDGNPKYVKDDLCMFKFVSRKVILMSVGTTLLSSQTGIIMQLQHWQKMSSNRYMPGLFNVKGDVCEFTESLSNDKPNILKTILLKLDNNLLENYKDVFHPCPYLGPIYVYNVSMPRGFAIPLMAVIPTADYKVDYRFFSKNGEEIFMFTLYLSDK